jgi:hypothetical protein
MMSDGTAHIIGTELGSVDTVNSIPPDSDKDIQLTYLYDTEADFNSAESSIPVGAIVGKKWLYADPEQTIQSPDYSNPVTILNLSASLSGLNQQYVTAPDDGYFTPYLTNSNFNVPTIVSIYVKSNNQNLFYLVTPPLSTALYSRLEPGLFPVRKGETIQIDYYTIDVDVRLLVNFYYPVFTKTPTPKIVVSPGHDLSLDEQPVLILDGSTVRQKLDQYGDPIFEKTYQIPSFTTEIYSVPLGFSLKRLVSLVGSLTNSVNGVTPPNFTDDLGFYNTYVSSDNVNVRAIRPGRPLTSGQITIQYTKS